MSTWALFSPRGISSTSVSCENDQLGYRNGRSLHDQAERASRCHAGFRVGWSGPGELAKGLARGSRRRQSHGKTWQAAGELRSHTVLGCGPRPLPFLGLCSASSLKQMQASPPSLEKEAKNGVTLSAFSQRVPGKVAL